MKEEKFCEIYDVPRSEQNKTCNAEDYCHEPHVYRIVVTLPDKNKELLACAAHLNRQTIRAQTMRRKRPEELDATRL